MVSGTHCRRDAGTVTRSAGHGGGIGRGGLNVRHGTTELLERAAAERGSARLAPLPDFPHARLLRGGAGDPVLAPRFAGCDGGRAATTVTGVSSWILTTGAAGSSRCEAGHGDRFPVTGPRNARLRWCCTPMR